MVMEAVLLGFFSYNRWQEYRSHQSNQITYRYWIASFLVSLGFLAYGLPALFTENPDSIILGGFVGMILNAIGFSNFFLIPLYGWLSPRMYIVAKHILFLFPIILALGMIVFPSNSFVDIQGIIHWRFNPVVGILAAAHMDIAFMANITLLYLHFYRLRHLSILNTLALMITFILTGIAGSYQYIGDDSLGLGLSVVVLYLGISVVFYSVARGKINRVLGWQNEERSATLGPNAKQNPGNSRTDS